MHGDQGERLLQEAAISATEMEMSRVVFYKPVAVGFWFPWVFSIPMLSLDAEKTALSDGQSLREHKKRGGMI